jgi:hypothetical protein
MPRCSYGTSIGAAELAKQGSIERATRYLRACTYLLSYYRIAAPPVAAGSYTHLLLWHKASERIPDLLGWPGRRIFYR